MLQTKCSGLLTTQEAAQYLRLSSKTLSRWKAAGTGPVYYPIGGRVYYKIADLDDWIEAQAQTPVRSAAPLERVRRAASGSGRDARATAANRAH